MGSSQSRLVLKNEQNVIKFAGVKIALFGRSLSFKKC